MSEKETKKWKKLSQTIQEEDTAERNEACKGSDPDT